MKKHPVWWQVKSCCPSTVTLWWWSEGVRANLFSAAGTKIILQPLLAPCPPFVLHWSTQVEYSLLLLHRCNAMHQHWGEEQKSQTINLPALPFYIFWLWNSNAFYSFMGHVRHNIGWKKNRWNGLFESKGGLEIQLEIIFRPKKFESSFFCSYLLGIQLNWFLTILVFRHGGLSKPFPNYCGAEQDPVEEGDQFIELCQTRHRSGCSRHIKPHLWCRSRPNLLGPNNYSVTLSKTFWCSWIYTFCVSISCTYPCSVSVWEFHWTEVQKDWVDTNW